MNHKDNKNLLEFSIFEPPINEKNKKPVGSITIKNSWLLITSDRYQVVTEAFRKLQSKEERGMMKRSRFAFVTFCAVLSHRKNEGLMSRSQYFCVDIDHQGEKVGAVWEAILSEIKPALMFRSPSADGIKVVLKIDTSVDHEKYFLAFQEFFRQHFSVEIDPSGKDIVRACFLPCDPDAYYSDDPTLFDKSIIDSMSTPMPATIGSNLAERLTISAAQLEDQEQNGNHPVEIARKMIRQAPDGEKHIVLLKASRLLGGYVGSGELDVMKATELLEEEIKNRNIESFPLAQQTIQNGLKYGIQAPLVSNPANHVSGTEAVEIPPESFPSQDQPSSEVIDAVEVETIHNIEFPIDGLPDFIKELIEKCVAVYHTPRDFWAASFLIATAVGTGNTVRLEGKYTNLMSLWWLFVAPSGFGKTEPLDYALKPYMKLDAANYARYRAEKAQFDSMARRAAPGGRDRHHDSNSQPPKCSQIILNDFTPEALVKVHSENPRGVCIYRDEFMGYIKDIGRYAKTGEEEFMLSLWSLKSAVINRKGQETLRLDDPCVTMAGGTQERLLTALAKDGRMDNGSLYRFGYIWPDKCSKPEYSNEVLPSAYTAAYEFYIGHLLTIPGENIMKLDREAEILYSDFFNSNASKANSESNDYLKEMYAKFDIMVLRIALIVHVMKIGCGEIHTEMICPETMDYAIRVTEYFRNTAKKFVHAIIPAPRQMSLSEVVIILRTWFSKTNQSELSRFFGVSQQRINQIFNNN